MQNQKKKETANLCANGGRKKIRMAAGFTLIESMIAIAVLTISLAGVSSAISNTSRQYEHQRKMTQALHLAEGTLESILLVYSTDSSLLSAGTHGPRCFNEVAEQRDCADSSVKYQVNWNIAANNPVAGMRHVTATVTWNEASGPKSFSLSTDRN